MTGAETQPPAGDAHLGVQHQPPEAALESTPGECPVVRLEDGTWAVTYTLVVDNSASDSRGYYELRDVPAFAEGVMAQGLDVVRIGLAST